MCEGGDGGVVAEGQAGLHAVVSINSSKVAKTRVERIGARRTDGKTSSELRWDRDLGERGRGGTGSWLPEHDAVKWAGVRGGDWGDQGALRRFRVAARHEGFGGLGRARAMKDIVHDSYGRARVHQHGASGRAGVHRDSCGNCMQV